MKTSKIIFAILFAAYVLVAISSCSSSSKVGCGYGQGRVPGKFRS